MRGQKETRLQSRPFRTERYTIDFERKRERLAQRGLVCFPLNDT